MSRLKVITNKPLSSSVYDEMEFLKIVYTLTYKEYLPDGIDKKSSLARFESTNGPKMELERAKQLVEQFISDGLIIEEDNKLYIDPRIVYISISQLEGNIRGVLETKRRLQKDYIIDFEYGLDLRTIYESKYFERFDLPPDFLMQLESLYQQLPFVMGEQFITKESDYIENKRFNTLVDRLLELTDFHFEMV